MKEVWKKCWGFIIALLISIVNVIFLTVEKIQLQKEVRVLKQERKVYGELSASCLKALEKYSQIINISCDGMIDLGKTIYLFAPSRGVLEKINDLYNIKARFSNDSVVFGNLREWLKEKGFNPSRSFLDSLGVKVSGKELKTLDF